MLKFKRLVVVGTLREIETTESFQKYLDNFEIVVELLFSEEYQYLLDTIDRYEQTMIVYAPMSIPCAIQDKILRNKVSFIETLRERGNALGHISLSKCSPVAVVTEVSPNSSNVSFCNKQAGKRKKRKTA